MLYAYVIPVSPTSYRIYIEKFAYHETACCYEHRVLIIVSPPPKPINMPNFSKINFIILPSPRYPTCSFSSSGFWTKNLYAVLISTKRITCHVPRHPYLTAHSMNLLTIIISVPSKAGSGPGEKKNPGSRKGDRLKIFILNLTLRRGVTLAWPERVNLYNRKIMLLPRKTMHLLTLAKYLSEEHTLRTILCQISLPSQSSLSMLHT